MYGKIFKQIFASTIAKNYLTRLVFMDLIVLADSDGIVDMQPEYIAAVTRVPLQVVTDALVDLEKPDNESRTPDEHGARIVRVSEHRTWGWYIVNYDLYRAMASEDQRREKTRARVRNLRNRSRMGECNAPVTHSNACNAMEKEREKDIEKEKDLPHTPKKKAVAIAPECEIVYKAYPRRVGKPKALISISRAISKFGFESVLKATKQMAEFWIKEGNLDYCPHPTTWFNQERFNDDPSTWAPKSSKQSPSKELIRIGLDKEKGWVQKEIDDLASKMQYDWDKTPERCRKMKELKSHMQSLLDQMAVIPR